MAEKNILLKEKLETYNNNNIWNKKTFAETVRNTIKPKIRISKIKVKRIKEEENSDMYYNVAQTIVNVKNIQARKIETINKHEPIVNCITVESAKATEKILTKKLAKIHNIVTEKLSKPKIKIVGIDSRLGNDMNKLQQDLQDRNFDKYSTKCTVLHGYTNGKTKN